MATRASSKKEPSQKAKPKADLPAEKVATPQPPSAASYRSNLSQPKEIADRSERGVKDGCSPDQQSETTRDCPGVSPRRSSPPTEPPASKPESVSLIDDTRSKRSESSNTEPKIKSVLPPISKIRPPILTKAPEPVVQPSQPILPEVVPVPAAAEPSAPGATRKSFTSSLQSSSVNLRSKSV